jgi:hypothetical protein
MTQHQDAAQRHDADDIGSRRWDVHRARNRFQRALGNPRIRSAIALR